MKLYIYIYTLIVRRLSCGVRGLCVCVREFVPNRSAGNTPNTMRSNNNIVSVICMIAVAFVYSIGESRNIHSIRKKLFLYEKRRGRYGLNPTYSTFTLYRMCNFKALYFHIDYWRQYYSFFFRSRVLRLSNVKDCVCMFDHFADTATMMLQCG